MYMTYTINPFKFTLETDGKGLWSDQAKSVQLTRIELEFDNNPGEGFDHLWGELRVYFDPKTWNPRKDGLIYTDKQFMDDLRGCLEVTGLNDSDVGYSEQGMQGEDYVSLDVGQEFISSWTFKDWAAHEMPEVTYEDT